MNPQIPTPSESDSGIHHRSMKTARWVGLIALVLGAVWIWLRDTGWRQSSSDTLPILLCGPLYYWLGGPWKWKSDAVGPGAKSNTGPWIFIAAFGMCLGAITGWNAPMALAWTLAFHIWETRFVEDGPAKTGHKKGQRLFDQRKALKIFPFLMFPWMQLDLQPIGWAFRISGAWVAAIFFQFTGFEVDREGVYLVVEGAPIVVDAACSGLNALQSMCVAGSLIAFWTFQPSRAFWLAVAVLPLFAWIANTLRIGMIGVVALTFGAEFAMGPFHEPGGWLVLAIMFIGSGFLFQRIQNWLQKNQNP